MTPDALIFDMDGTLWDATASYAQIWNVTCEHYGISTHFDGTELIPLMGKSISEILDVLLGDDLTVTRTEFLQLLGENEQAMMPQLGGKLYPGVSDGLKLLASRYRLFMLSNCSASGLKNFTAFTGTASLFSGLLTQGERPVSKSENLSYMKELYKLKCPVYVGDTQSDCDHAHAAAMTFAHAEYGFGRCHDADLAFGSFSELTQHFMKA